MSEERWLDLRKGKTLLYIEYGHTHTNLWAEHARARTSDTVEIQLDLNLELRRRNKQSNSTIDARQLAEGGIERLTLVQCNDDRILGGLLSLARKFEDPPDQWRLVLLLDGEHRFEVKPEISRSNRSTLFLRVVQS